jgi:hypothetical protein
MLVKVLNMIDIGAGEIEEALNKELTKLKGYWINDIKIYGDLAIILYTEPKKKR